MSAVTLHLPDALQTHIAALAARGGYSVDQFLISAASEKLSAMLTVNYLQDEASKGIREDFERYMEAVPPGPALSTDIVPPAGQAERP